MVERTPSTTQFLALAAGLVAAACTGAFGEDDYYRARRPGSGSVSTDDKLAACANAPVAPGVAPLRRLTRSQYNNVVRDLLGDTTRPGDAFPPDAVVGNFSNNAAALTVSPLLAQGYFLASETLAQNALKNKASLLPCDPQAGEDACARQFVAKFATRAFRRPVAIAEVDALMTVYTDNKSGGTFDDGVEAVIETILNDARFLYLEEYGSADMKQGNVLPVAPYEMASRLSFFLWNSMPDDVLFAAAGSNQLATVEQVKAQAKRMLADPKAKDASREFFDQWLQLDKLAGVTKDPATYAEFDANVRDSMLGETRGFLDYVMWKGDAKVSTLFTAPITFLDANTAKIYGLPYSGSGFVQTSLDGKQRAGILTQPSILTAVAKPNQSSPVLRGKYVRERFLCQTLPPPPPTLKIVPPEVKPGSTTRERFDQHAAPECIGCHKRMDPIGFGFEHFDGIGRWRDTDQNLPVDASGTLTDSDVDGDFNGVTELAQKLAKSDMVSDCVSVQWYRYAMARSEGAEDNCSVLNAGKAFGDAGHDLRELLIGITTTDAFRFRMEVKP